MRIDGGLDRLGEADTALGRERPQLGHGALQRLLLHEPLLGGGAQDGEPLARDLVVGCRESAFDRFPITWR